MTNNISAAAGYTCSSRRFKVILPPFIFSCRWIVQFCTIQRQLKTKRREYMLVTTLYTHPCPRSLQKKPKPFVYNIRCSRWLVCRRHQ
jgi:hypothetical protein